jgi:hypothetical protein
MTGASEARAVQDKMSRLPDYMLHLGRLSSRPSEPHLTRPGIPQKGTSQNVSPSRTIFREETLRD